MVLPENYTQYFRLASSMARKYRKVADSFPVSQPTEITQEMGIANNTKPLVIFGSLRTRSFPL